MMTLILLKTTPLRPALSHHTPVVCGKLQYRLVRNPQIVGSDVILQDGDQKGVGCDVPSAIRGPVAGQAEVSLTRTPSG